MTFRIAVWNCARALHSKCDKLSSLGVDVAIVPECAEPDILRRKAPDFAFTDCEWTGENKDIGLGVFSFGKTTLRRHQSWDRSHHIFLPVEVRGATSPNLLAVWAFNQRVPATVTPNPTTTRHALEHYAPFLTTSPSVVAGDFNSNVMWDEDGKYSSFAEVDRTLGSYGLVSAYHAHSGEALGKETRPTHFLQRNRDKTYHIDYVYIPRSWAERKPEVTVGGVEEWLGVSDHAPVVVTVPTP